MKDMLTQDWGKSFATCPDETTKQWEIFYDSYTSAEQTWVPRKIIQTGKKTFVAPLDKKKTLAKKRKR